MILLLQSESLKVIQDVKQQLSTNFLLKDLGPLKYFLGQEVARHKKGIAVCQRKYAVELLEDTGFTSAKLVFNPTVPSHKLSRNEGEFLEDNSQYRRIVGKLFYLTITRPDISFATQQLSQFLDKPTDLHLQAAHRVLRYIKAAPGQEFGVDHSEAVAIYCDSKSDVAIAENPVFHERTKYIELDCHLVREKLHKGLIKLFHIASEKQLADPFTKTHYPTSFQHYISKLGLVNLYNPACGGISGEEAK
ncbi:PREDICTED: uncharacterized protein LOC109158081 [Ipomoea nil]|uniref:uncharacterized protein LOC109158081 n=1 Tax=Ipomoea nil TaxID=35883 RepID=UPI000901DF1D|nr:PREDICTED: uncharacterized protein LOC109158081 [Ipomoea nil]